LEQEKSLESIVDSLLGNPKSITILEAGCGSINHFKYSKEARLVGIDISQEQLDKNDYLSEKILGDLESDLLPSSKFDLIICWDVLEHLIHPNLALSNMNKAAKSGGLLILASPNVLTLRGLLTKFTPHWVHVWYYKYFIGLKEAGTPGNYPFKSFHKFSMSPPAIRRFAKKNNLSIELYRFSTWDHPEYERKWFMLFWRTLNLITKILSLGYIGTDAEQGYNIILRKTPQTKRSV